MTSAVGEVRAVADLLAVIRAGVRPKYVFFWGHQPGRDVGASCLSQWWPAEFTVGGHTYPSAEHHMMAAKAELFGDTETAARIRRAAHPGEAKALGRQVRGFVEQRWVDRRFEIVVAGNLAKFGQHAELRAFLLGTGDRVLVEASPLDRIWGIGLAAGDERAGEPEAWQGQNLLGFALMEVRDRLRAGRVD
ncbi:NADAR family protein [Goodfellowiella coeruleoviolacea]|uniref:NADAR domain-containing protein n=1 Tax=Goodfellowiella coeruleoviolacea TaxID=334858 RepID=A0AAE3GE50_9PSEU|nr:NADAR family protein [Goodfellowiella coeruleoviolacea]MCP2165644.1 hypothetical protein [Goodfellowiella coeruleoviolacea]